MTTIVDPNGTPIPVYNRGGVTIQTITANGTTFGSGTQVVSPSGHAVVSVITSANPDTAFILPVGADIGDVVECYPERSTFDVSHLPRAFPATGDTILQGSISSLQIPQFGGFFRKITSTDWIYFHGGG